MASKTHLEKNITFTWDGVDLSTDLIPGSLSGVGLEYPDVDMTGVGDGVTNTDADRPDGEVGGQFHMNDGASGALTKLSATVTSSGTLTVAYGADGAAPTTGDPEWEGTYRLMGFTVAPNGGRNVISARWKPTGGTAPAWGTVS